MLNSNVSRRRFIQTSGAAAITNPTGAQTAELAGVAMEAASSIQGGTLSLLGELINLHFDPEEVAERHGRFCVGSSIPVHISPFLRSNHRRIYNASLDSDNVISNSLRQRITNLIGDFVTMSSTLHVASEIYSDKNVATCPRGCPIFRWNLKAGIHLLKPKSFVGQVFHLEPI